MYRVEIAVIVFSVLPFLIALVFRAAVIPRRKSNMLTVLESARRPSARSLEDDRDSAETTQYVASGIRRVDKDFDSLYSTRLLFPAFLLTVFYMAALTLGVSVLAKGKCPVLPCFPFSGCFQAALLVNPIFASVGAYVFNMGVLIRRSFMADITKNVYWASINRLIIACGFAIVLYPMLRFKPSPVFCFAAAFVPRLFITLIRKKTTQLLGSPDTGVEELDIQLVQGIDVWKEERLEEEGIESVQNLATADVLTLAVKTHYPLRTLVDWMDQAILVQRFPIAFKALQKAGMSVSAIELAALGLASNPSLTALLAQKIDIDVLILEQAMSSFSQDAAVRILWRLWQSRDAE